MATTTNGKVSIMDLYCNETMDDSFLPVPNNQHGNSGHGKDKCLEQRGEGNSTFTIWGTDKDLQATALEEACLSLMELGYGSNLLENQFNVNSSQSSKINGALFKIIQSVIDVASHHQWIVEMHNISDRSYREKFFSNPRDLPWTDMEFLMDQVANNLLQPFLVKKILTARCLEMNFGNDSRRNFYFMMESV